MAVGEPAPREVRSPPLTAAQRCWFGAVAFLGAVFLFVLPPFQGADEYKHFLRAWNVAEGNLTCGELPQGVIDARAAFEIRSRSVKIGLTSFDNALATKAEPGSSRKYTKMACGYPPYAYLVPALVIRGAELGKPASLRRGGPIKTYYAGRLANWVCMCLAVLWFLRAVPWCRNVTLFFLSIPEVIEQTSSFNTELAQFAFMFVMLAALLRAPTSRRIVVIGGMAVLLTMIKPVFALYGLVALPPLLVLRSTVEASTRRLAGMAVLLLVAPALLWQLWTVIAHVKPVLGEGVDPAAQIAFLEAHPLHVFRLFGTQLVDLFGHNLMKGSWGSILGGFGPARLELPMHACFLLLFGLVAAGRADLACAVPPPSISGGATSPRQLRWSWVIAIASIGIVIPGSVLAMYVYYTPVGADAVYGVQGRYYLVPLFMLIVLGIRLIRSRWPDLQIRWGEASAWLAAAACVWADLAAVRAIARSYWGT